MSLPTYTNEKYVNSSRFRPNELEVAGSGHYCCIPGCKSSTLDKDKNKSYIGIFSFPSDSTLRKHWENIISQFRRKGKYDSYDPRKSSTKVCEFHFPIEDIKCSDSGIKSLRPGADPKVFKFKATKVEQRRSPRKRKHLNLGEQEDIESDVQDNEVIGEYAEYDGCAMDEVPYHSSCNNCETHENEIAYLRKENERLKHENVDITSELLFVKEEYSKLKKKTYTYENVSKDPVMFKSANGLQVMAFEKLLDFLKPGEDCSNIKFYLATRVSDIRNTKKDVTETAKTGPKPEIAPKEQLFLLLSWLKNGYTLRHASWLFDTPKSTISRYITTWLNFMYFSLGSIPVWPSKEQVMDTARIV